MGPLFCANPATSPRTSDKIKPRPYHVLAYVQQARHRDQAIVFRSGPVLAPLTITVIFFNGTLPKYFFLISFYEDKRTWRYCLSSFFVGPVKVKLVTSAEQLLSIRPLEGLSARGPSNRLSAQSPLISLLLALNLRKAKLRQL